MAALPDASEPILPSGELPPPLDTNNPPPLDQYCDLVMQGGVVDGVIYPGVLTELARRFRFQSIAGTSVGAIAASLAAASEFARRFGSDDGFNQVLRKIPQELAKPNPSDASQTKLRSLFQPDAKLQRLFLLLVDVLSVTAAQRIPTLLRTFVQYYGRFLLVGALLFGALPLAMLAYFLLTCQCNHMPTSALAAYLTVKIIVLVLVILLGAVIALAVALYRDYLALASNGGFGFCSGMSLDGGATEGLVEWLHKGIQGAAKLPLSRPLCFEDLWSAPGGPRDAQGQPAPLSINLRMISTAVSHGRPYEFPIDPNSTRLFFKLSEFKDYFPESVFNYLEKVAKPYEFQTSVPSATPGEPTDLTSPDPNPDPNAQPIQAQADKQDFRELPIGELPILVAARLSMNFPVLFKSVPLWAIDEERGRFNKNAPVFRRVWFSDGGISSNFPIHFFDEALPSWPTFGVYLADQSRHHRYERAPGKPAKPQPPYWLPRFHTEGKFEKWLPVFSNDDEDLPPEQKSKKMAGKLKQDAGFISYLGGIARTAKDWADNANLRTPGVRERVVYVYKNGSKDPSKGEAVQTHGGLNLKLPGKNIEELGYFNGVAAGQALVRKFLGDSPTANKNLSASPGWLDHRWTRFNAYLNALQNHLAGFSQAAQAARATPTLAQQIAQAQNQPPLYTETYFEPTLTANQAQALQNATHAIEALEAALAQNKVYQPYQDAPQPKLGLRPGL